MASVPAVLSAAASERAPVVAFAISYVSMMYCLEPDVRDGMHTALPGSIKFILLAVWSFACTNIGIRTKESNLKRQTTTQLHLIVEKSRSGLDPLNPLAAACQLLQPFDIAKYADFHDFDFDAYLTDDESLHAAIWSLRNKDREIFLVTRAEQPSQFYIDAVQHLLCQGKKSFHTYRTAETLEDPPISTYQLLSLIIWSFYTRWEHLEADVAKSMIAFLHDLPARVQTCMLTQDVPLTAVVALTTNPLQNLMCLAFSHLMPTQTYDMGAAIKTLLTPFETDVIPIMFDSRRPKPPRFEVQSDVVHYKVTSVLHRKPDRPDDTYTAVRNSKPVAIKVGVARNKRTGAKS